MTGNTQKTDPSDKSTTTAADKTKVIVKKMYSIGNLSAFDPEKDQFDDWKIIFESYCKANDLDHKTDTKGKCHAILLSSIGSTNVSLLKNLFAPKTLDTVGLQDLLDKLDGHYKPIPKALAERFRFMKRTQNSSETIAEYMAELRKLANRCKFEPTNLDERLRDQLILGLQSERAQSHILTLNDDIKLEDVVKAATAREIADKSTALLRGSSSSSSKEEGEVKKMSKYRSTKFHKNGNKGYRETEKKSQQQQQDKGSTSQKSSNDNACTRCGKHNHSKKDCPHMDAKCYACGNTGHFATMCKSKKKDSSIKSVKTVNRNSNVNATKKQITLAVKIAGVHHEKELDTACDLTVLSDKFWRELGSLPLEKSKVTFKTYTNENFTPKGQFSVEIEYEGQRKTMCIQVGKGSSLFGKDLIEAFKLNWNNIIEKDWKQCHSVQSATEKNEELEKLLCEYQDIFKAPDTNDRINGFKAKIVLKEEATPKFLKARPLPFAVRSKVESELLEMERIGVITKIDHSEWASPLVVVPKPNGKVRITGDFKSTVNSQLCITQYPIAVPEDLFATVSGGEKFSKLDGSNAYHQIELEESCKKFLVINTHKGFFQYNVLPQGIASSPAIFQEFADTMISDIPQSGSYIDDMVTTGKGDREHLKSLKCIFERMRKFNYRLSPEKCVFMKSEIEFLGHVINEQGILPTETKVKDIMDMPEPSDVSELRSFLGLVQFYGKFMKELGDLCEPLYQLTKLDIQWQWNNNCKAAFAAVKKTLSSAPLLVHFNPELPIGIACDASSKALGVVLFHKIKNGEERPIAYASKVLSETEKRYSQIEKEGLSIIFGIKRFYKYLCARQFLLVTDHKPLLKIFGPKSQLPTYVATRLHHWSVYLSQFQYDVIYRKSSDHGNADALSRKPATKEASILSTAVVKKKNNHHRGNMKQRDPEENGDNETEIIINKLCEEQTEILPVTAAAIRKATSCDKTLSKVIQFHEVGWPSEISKEESELQPYFSRRDELQIVQGVIMWEIRVIVPAVLQQQMLEQLHEAHFEIVRMKSIARQYVYWPKIDNDIEEIAKNCQHCQQQQPNPQSAPLHPWVYPERPWQRLHVDLAGPLHKKMWLVIVDAHSKWPEIFNMNENTTTAAVLDKLKEIIARFGLPMQIVSDNGRQFTSEEFEKFCGDNGIKHLCSSVYHPRSNGEAERLVRTFKEGMRGDSKNLHHRLQKFLLHYRSTAHATTGSSPAELLQGRKLRTTIDLVRPNLHEKVADSQAKQEASYNSTTKMRNFNSDDDVWVQTFSRNDQKWERGKVIKAIGPVTYLVLVDGRKLKRHVDHVRRALQSQVMVTPCAGTSVPEEASIDSTPVTTPVSSPQRQPLARGTPVHAAANDSRSTSTARSTKPKREKKPVVRFGSNK